MGAFIIRRTLWTIMILLVVSIVTFLLMRAIPGGPFQREKDLPEAIKQNLEAKYNMDEPLYVQYLDYIGGIFIPRIKPDDFQRTALEDYLVTIDLPGDSQLKWGNFGPSLRKRNRTISGIIRENLPVSAQLGLAAIGVAVAIGVPMGILAALNRNSFWDYFGMSVATVGVSITVITSGPLLQYLFGVNWRLLPVSGWGTWQHMVMPAFALGFTQAALVARLTRASMLQVLHEDYIRTARAKGLHNRRVIWLHALKNAMIPVVTVLGPITAFLVTGSFIAESIFGVPGIGEKFVTSITDRDYPLMIGTTLLFSFIVIVANLLVDISYAVLDPRIRYS